MSSNSRCAGKAWKTSGRRPLVLAITAALAVAGSFPVATIAADSNWTGAASTDWHDAANWSVPPANGGSVLIGRATPHASELGSGNAQIHYLTVGGSAGGSLRIDGGSALHVTDGEVGDGPSQPIKGLVIGDAVGSTGDVTVRGTGSVLTVENYTHVGYDGTGTLSVLDGGTANLGLNVPGIETLVGFGYFSWGVDADRTGSGSINLDGAGSTLNHGGGMNVSNGNLTITNGARLDGTANRPGDWLDVLGMGLPASGEFPGIHGNAVATVSGAGSAWVTNNSLIVGAGGDGRLSISQGGTAAFVGEVTVGGKGDLQSPEGQNSGLQRAGTGSLLVSGTGSTLTVAASDGRGIGMLDVGGAGDGAMAVEDGAGVSVAGTLTVGAQRTGSLKITGGGTLTASGSDANGIGATFGRDAGAQGEVTVSGNGSTFVVDAGAQIGNAGTGSLSVLDGGTASLGLSAAYSEIVVGMGYYGFPNGVENGTGKVVVDGSGSTITYAGGFNLLDGSLAITGGGHLQSQVRAADGDTFWLDAVGFGTPAYPDWDHVELDGSGEVTISGAGSRWDSVNGLSVGQGGTGTLSILDGGQASFTGLMDLARVGYLMDENGQIVGTRTGSANALVSGPGSRLSVQAAPANTNGGAGRMLVGEDGAATLVVEQQGQVSMAGTLTVGGKSQGSVSITNGGVLTVGGSDTNGIGAKLGRDAGAQGEITVSGQGSALVVDAGTQIGNAGTGSLSVFDGGTASLGLSAAYSEVVVGPGYYGLPDGVEPGTGAVAVGGSGSTITYAGGFNLLDGSLAITGGGQLQSQVRAADGDTFWLDVVGLGAPAHAGRAELDSTGEVIVSGVGSQWSSVNGLTLGRGGTATLSILDGGQASFLGFADLGSVEYATDENRQIVATKIGSASVLVSGAGSSLSVAALGDGTDSTRGVINLGVEGVGALQVSDGAGIAAADSIRIGTKGSLVIGSGTGDRLAGDVDTLRAIVEGKLVFSHGSSGYVFAPGIEGNGAIDVAGGFTRLTGNGGAFTGQTVVDDGATLSVNGSLGGTVTVAVGGRLEGTGTIGDADVGGTLAPGNSPGTLHVGGDLLMRDTSVYEAQIDTVTGASDSIEVAGNVTIQPGSTLKIENISGGVLKPGDSLKLIQATGTVDGQFALVDDPVSPFLGFGLSYGDGGITVGVTRSALSFASVGSTPTEKAVGRALDSVPDDSALASVLYGELDNTAKAAAAIRQMPGLLAADVRRVMLDDSRLPRDAVLGRLQRTADAAEATAFWVQGMGYWGSTDAADGVPKAKSNSSGIVLGTDAGLGSSTRLGMAAGFGQTSYRMAGQNASAHLTSTHLALYGRSGTGALGLSYGAAYSWNKVDSNRSFDIGAARQQLNGDHDARTGQVFADVGYRLGSDPARYLEPFVSTAYAVVDSDDWKETGTAAALATRSGTDHAIFGTLGLRWSATTASARLFGTVGWRHVFGFDRAAAQQSFVAGGDAFEVRGLPIARDAAVVDLGLDFAIARHARVTTAYSGLIAGSSRDHGGRIQLSFDF